MTLRPGPLPAAWALPSWHEPVGVDAVMPVPYAVIAHHPSLLPGYRFDLYPVAAPAVEPA